ncbi:MAG TPA: hypothetical protein VFZ65_00125 [Planctomycetota bacterium]|nr:hypothetical protein [Planctomycetota bacterium]
MATPSSTVELTLRGRVVAWLAALAAGAAWLGDDANARLAAAMLTAPLLVDYVAKQRRLHHVEVRVGSRRTIAGALFTEHLTVVHRGRRCLRECLLAEPRTMRSEPAVLMPPIRPMQPTAIGYRARSLQRSHVLERVFLLVSTWPLGLFRTRAVLSVAADMITEPARVQLDAAIVQAIAEREVAPRHRTRLPGPEFHALREHLLDEDARGVHALRSASVGTLVRRVTQGRVPQTVGLVLDMRRPPGRSLYQGTRRFEWSLGACATLIAWLRARSAQLQVLVIDAEPTKYLVQGPAIENELLTLLAEASPTPHRPLSPELFEEVRRLEHCYWIPAGAYLASPEFAAMSTNVTIVGGDFE